MSTMIDRGAAIAAAVEVEKYSKQGTELLQSGHLTGAVKAFKYAYRFAGDLDDDYMERACAFNLGAAYIAMGQGEKGLNILKHAVPSEDRRDGRSNGDLHFNFGLGYESTRNVQEAIRSFNKALEEYRYERDNLTMEIETLRKLAVLYHMTHNNHLMNTYHQLAEAYAMQENVEKQMWALCEKANTYNRYGDVERAEAAADECYKLSEKCDNTAESGNIFNDLGLLYTQLQKYDKAVSCFQEALPLAQSSDDRKREAVIRQNLGAAYNFIGEYQRAISFHKSAADMYARLQNRNSQGQCYANLAYAYSQIGDIPKSKEAFKHALLAAEDTDDNRTTWQVSEGLGSVAFSEGDYDESIEFFKKALGVLAAKESNITAQNRIVEKLKQALEGQIKDRERPFGHITKEDVGPLKSGFKKQFVEKPTRPAPVQPVVEEAVEAAITRVKDPEGRILQKRTRISRKKYQAGRYVRVSKSASSKRFSKVARGLSDLMGPPFNQDGSRQEPVSSRDNGSLQGETLKPVQSESEEGSSESESESGSETGSDESQKFKTETSRPGPSSMSKTVETGSLDTNPGTEKESSSSGTEDSSSEEDEDEDAKAVKEQMRKFKDESEQESEEDKDRGNEKTENKRPQEKKQDESSGSSESESGSETGSTGSSSEDEAPPVPSGTIPRTGQMNTYEEAPRSRPGSKKKLNYADIDFDSSPRRGGHEDDDDPLYQSIPSRTLRDDDIIQAKSPKSYSDFASLPRGESTEEDTSTDGERIMYSKHQQDQLERQSAPPLPRRGEKDSKTCSVM